MKRLASDIERPIEAVLHYTPGPYESMSEAERYTVRYNVIVIAEAIAALAIHTARRLRGEEPPRPLCTRSRYSGKGTC
ncbi:MAG: hypothetical protein QXY49_05930 [Thermofilaceae archaeon]